MNNKKSQKCIWSFFCVFFYVVQLYWVHSFKLVFDHVSAFSSCMDCSSDFSNISTFNGRLHALLQFPCTWASILVLVKQVYTIVIVLIFLHFIISSNVPTKRQNGNVFLYTELILKIIFQSDWNLINFRHLLICRGVE